MVADKLMNDSDLNSFMWLDRLNKLGPIGFSMFLFAVLLTMINWMLEILKWKTLAGDVAPISLMQATRQSLSSLTASLLTPNRIGEYGAKAIYFSRVERPRIIMLNFLGNAYQMMSTLIFGVIGLLSLGKLLSLPSSGLTWILAAAMLVALVMIFIIVFQKKWSTCFRRIQVIFSKIPYQIHRETFLYSMLRYLIFSHQFYLFLVFFGVDTPYELAMPLIFVMYFISSVIPGFVIFDWLVKGSVALTIFHFFDVNDIVILCITASMWMLNFAIPSIIGSFYVFTFKSRRFVFSESKQKG